MIELCGDVTGSRTGVGFLQNDGNLLTAYSQQQTSIQGIIQSINPTHSIRKIECRQAGLMGDGVNRPDADGGFIIPIRHKGTHQIRHNIKTCTTETVGKWYNVWKIHVWSTKLWFPTQAKDLALITVLSATITHDQITGLTQSNKLATKQGSINTSMKHNKITFSILENVLLFINDFSLLTYILVSPTLTQYILMINVYWCLVK